MPPLIRFLLPVTRLTALVALASLSAQASAQPASASAAEEVTQLISRANLGKPPTLWFATDPRVNLGSGPTNWSAQSGGQLAARGPDAWMRKDAAFGLAPDAKGGVAVSGSTVRDPINVKAGSVLLFFRADPKSKPPMLLFSRADWGNPNYLSLRINAVGSRWELTLAATEQRTLNRATQASFATISPGSWTFVALTWQEIGERCQFRYWAGDLASGELTEGDYETSPLDPTPGTFIIAGRRADNIARYGTSSLLFSDGLLQNFAIYNDVLSEDVIKRIYVAASRR